MASISQLTLYSGACRIIGTTAPATLTENTETRRLLDAVWGDGGDYAAIDACLEDGLWNFAMRTASIDYDSSISPDFGFNRAQLKPTDWVRTECIASDENFINRLTDLGYRDEAGYWFTWCDTIYVRYVSNDEDYGHNYSLWPHSFKEFVEAYLAFHIVGKLRDASRSKEDVERAYTQARTRARSRDAMNEGVAFPPTGTWVRARMRGTRGDGGSWGRLIG